MIQTRLINYLGRPTQEVPVLPRQNPPRENHG